MPCMPIEFKIQVSNFHFELKFKLKKKPKNSKIQKFKSKLSKMKATQNNFAMQVLPPIGKVFTTAQSSDSFGPLANRTRRNSACQSDSGWESQIVG